MNLSVGSLPCFKNSANPNPVESNQNPIFDACFFISEVTDVTFGSNLHFIDSPSDNYEQVNKVKT